MFKVRMTMNFKMACIELDSRREPPKYRTQVSVINITKALYRCEGGIGIVWDMFMSLF